MKSVRGRQLHEQALQVQEEGKYLEALKFEDEALMAYLEDKDEAGLAEIWAMRMLTTNMIGDRYGRKELYVVARHYALISLELAERAGAVEQVALAHGTIGRALVREESYTEAAEHFVKAREILATATGEHNRKSVLADFRNHAATSRMLAGDAVSEAEALEAIEELKASKDANEHEYKVWLSGGYMRLAHAWANLKDKNKASRYFKMAEEVAVGDDMTVRQEQLKQLKEALGL